MYLKSIRLNNYRVHRETFVEFDRHLTLIGGPNESGKSTLVEAAHRVLFLRHRTTGEVLKEMMSLQSAEPPEVELTFSNQGVIYTIHKKFAAGKGTALLTSSSGLNLRNDEAEEKLGEIFGTQSSRYTSDFWSHLWVWQGTSTHNLLSQAEHYRDDLIQKLQRLGAAGLIQSDLDSRLNTKVIELYESIFNKNESLKVTAEAAQAEKQLKTFQETLKTKRERFSELQHLAEQYENADQRLKDIAQQTAKQHEALTKAQEDHKRATKIQRKSEELERSLKDDQNALANFENSQRNFDDLQKRKKVAERKLDSLKPSFEILVQNKKNAESEYRELAVKEEQLSHHLRATRLQLNVAQALSQLDDQQKESERLVKVLDQVAMCKDEITLLEHKLASLPELNKKNLQDLGKQNNEILKAEATLKAMSASVKLVRSDDRVTLDGKTLSVDTEYPFSTAVELVIGEKTCLQITPGDGTSLADASRNLIQLKKRWQEMLDQFKVSSLEEAQNFFDERQRLSQLMQSLQAKLKELDSTNTQLRFQEIQNRVERLTREKERDSQALQSLLVEQKLHLVDLLSDETWQTRLSSLEADQQTLSQNLSLARKRIGDCGDRLHELDNEIKDCDREIRTAGEQMKLEEKNLGEPAQREAKLAELKLRIEEQNGELKQLQVELNEIQPEHLERIIKRQSESIKNLDKQKEEAIGLRAGALSKLQSDGSVDMYAELAAAESAVQYAELQYEQRRREAFAIKLLKDLFEREQKKLTDSLTEPFVQRMKKYVQCFTGEVSKISFEVTNKGFTELRIARSSDNNTPVDFDQLSGGAREQIAAAARLAVAEVLASDSADGLPIVFDDAFSYSDSRRLEALPRMIEHAIDAGLQVIIVTCNPLQYAALGATTVQISRK